MAKFNDIWRTAREVFAPIGTGLGAAMTVIGGMQSVLGINPMGGERLLIVGLMVFAVCGAWVIITTHRKVAESDSWIGDENKRALWRDGIPALQAEYMHRVQSGDYAVVRRFWDAGFANVQDANGRKDLHIACEFGHKVIALGLLEKGVDAQQMDRSNRTPLMLAMWKGDTTIVDALLLHDAATNAICPDDGCTALHYAAAHGHLHVVESLLKNGARIDLPDNAGMSPLMAAIAKERWDVAGLLLAKGSDASRTDESGATLMDYAEAFSAPNEIRKTLSQAGVVKSPQTLQKTGGGFSRYGHVRVHWSKVNPTEPADSQ